MGEGGGHARWCGPSRGHCDQVFASKVGHGGFTGEQDRPVSSCGGDGRERKASVDIAAVAASVAEASPGCSGRLDLVGGGRGCARGRHRQQEFDQIVEGRRAGRRERRRERSHACGRQERGVTRAHLSAPIFWLGFAQVKR
jgi:hypothetical protein